MTRYPKSLHEKGKAFWKSVLNRWTVEGEALAVLEATCNNLDLFHDLRAELVEKGFSTLTREGTLKTRPEAKVMTDAFRNFLAGCKYLGLDVEEPDAMAPPRIGRPTETKAEKKWHGERVRQFSATN